MHDFFGNRTTNAFSNYSSLLAGAANCIEDFQANFRMIAGDSHATAPQPTSVVWWSCKNARGLSSDTTSGKQANLPYCGDVNPDYEGFRGGPGTAFSSGGAYSGHADFINAWVQDTLKMLVTRCLVNTEHCG